MKSGNGIYVNRSNDTGSVVDPSNKWRQNYLKTNNPQEQD